MRKIILNLAVSLDSFIEDPNGEYDWCLTDQDYGMTAFLERTDAIFFGRKSYELVKQLDPDMYPEKIKYVFTRTLKDADSGVNLISNEIETEIQTIKNQEGKDIWLFGGANLTTHLMNSGLVEELQLSVHPVVLGKGKPLFQDIAQRTYFTLINTQTFSTGLVQLHYELKRQ